MPGNNIQIIKKSDLLLWLRREGKAKDILCQIFYGSSNDDAVIEQIKKFSCNTLNMALYRENINIQIQPGHDHQEE